VEEPVDLEVCVASHVGGIDHVVSAKALGDSHAWLTDGQRLWSDCYAALALAASRTSRIRIGTGIAVSGTRPAPVTAASIATLRH
jgi:5,10-methylenetetrahydromethanopterin reductase